MDSFWTAFWTLETLAQILDKYAIGETLITLLTLAITESGGDEGGEFSSLPRVRQWLEKTEAIAVTLLCSGLLEA